MGHSKLKAMNNINSTDHLTADIAQDTTGIHTAPRAK